MSAIEFHYFVTFQNTLETNVIIQRDYFYQES